MKKPYRSRYPAWWRHFDGMREMEHVEIVKFSRHLLPKHLVARVKKSEAEGIPTAVGIHTRDGKSRWCMVQSGQGPYIAYLCWRLIKV